MRSRFLVSSALTIAATTVAIHVHASESGLSGHSEGSHKLTSTPTPVSRNLEPGKAPSSATLSASATHRPVLPLKEVVVLARNSPNTKAYAAVARAAEADKDRAEWALYPQLGVSYSTNNGKTWYGNSSQTVSAVASYLLFDGGRTKHGVNEKAFAAESEGFNAMAESDRMAIAAAQFYLDAVRYEELSYIAQQNVKRHEQVAGLIGEIVAADYGRKSDLALVKSRLAIAKKTLATLEQQLRNSQALFEEITGVKAVGLARPMLSKAQRISGSEAELIARAEAYSPVLLAARKVYDATGARVEADRKWYIPDVNVQVSKPIAMSGEAPGTSRDSVVGLYSTWNTTDRLSGAAALRASRERMDGQSEKIESIRRSIATSVREQSSLIDSLMERRSSAYSQRTSLESVSESYWDQFKIGRRTLLDALNSENDLFSARIEEAALEYDDLLAHLRIFALEGALDEQVGVLTYTPVVSLTML